MSTYGFTKFPNTWRISLAKVRANGCAYRVAFYLLDQRRWREHVTLSTVALNKLGVSRKGKRTALQQLRKAGLIEVEERLRKSPIVKVRFKE
jgi:hypothetical protein